MHKVRRTTVTFYESLYNRLREWQGALIAKRKEEVPFAAVVNTLALLGSVYLYREFPNEDDRLAFYSVFLEGFDEDLKEDDEIDALITATVTKLAE